MLSIDLPPDQVLRAMRGFAQVIAQSEAAPPAPRPTDAPVAHVVATPLVPVTPAPQAAVQLGALSKKPGAKKSGRFLKKAAQKLFYAGQRA